MSPTAEQKSVKRYFIKGKRVTEKAYLKRLQFIEICKTRNFNNKECVDAAINKSVEKEKEKSENGKGLPCCSGKIKSVTKKIEKEGAINGRRIVNIPYLAKQLYCSKCKSLLSLEDILVESKHGLASIYHVKCRQCSVITLVPTDTTHTDNKNKTRFDTNTKAAIGVLNGGMGLTHLNKLFAALNIPELYWKTFESYQNEVGQAIELEAEEACLLAAYEERCLTIQNKDQILKLLPPHLDLRHIFPDSSDINNIKDDNIVRVAGSFDMGWITRGSGRSYDSLTGTAALIGYFTKKVIAYVVYNRKCRKCDLGHPKEDHNCKNNFAGSAKSMEPSAAVHLTKDNSTLLKVNLQVAVIIADNDSSSMCAIRDANDYEIPKQSDIGHTGKGLMSDLYAIKSKHKELNTSVIDNLVLDFKYSIAQTVGDSTAMKKAINNIPNHCFNIHDECGEWCRYNQDPVHYTHRILGDGLYSSELKEDLVIIFEKYANKSNQFLAGASSNANESLNLTITSKFPKTRMYGTSCSGNMRIACAINKKNEGEMFVSHVNQKVLVSPGVNTAKLNLKLDNKAKKRYEKSITKQFKLRRINLKSKKSARRNNNELLEGKTYESDMAMGSTSATVDIKIIDESIEPIYIYMDTETGGFRKSSDLLQIGALYDNHQFSVYIQPTQAIDSKATEKHNLSIINGVLTLHSKPVPTVPLLTAIVQFYEFLSSFNRKCILVAHNCTFDYERLFISFRKVYMINHFKSIIHGFCDSLPIIKKKNPVKGKNANTLTNVASYFKIEIDGAHDALIDVILLEKVLIQLNVTNKDLMDSFVTYEYAYSKKELLNKLTDLKCCTSLETRRKIIKNGITLNSIIKVCKENGKSGIEKLFGKDENGKIRVSQSKIIIDKIVNYINTNNLYTLLEK